MTLTRKTPMKRGPSKKRRAQLPERAEVRRAVLARDRGCVAEGIPGVPHGNVGDRRGLEVNELTRGAGRGSAWLDAGLCVSLCARSHDFVTANPAKAKAFGLAIDSNLPPAMARLQAKAAAEKREQAKRET